MENNSPKSLGYVVVTDYIDANTGKDVSDEIQKIIDENPMRTIYFPDGEYILSKPICTSARPAASVSLHLSCFAVLKAADGWNHTEAMVRLGASEHYNTIYENGSNYYFTGGVVDGNMVANGISIESGRETSVRNTSIKHTFIGLHIKHGSNSNSSDADIEAVHIVGNNKKNSIGVLLDGCDNTLSNMRIAAVQTGVMVKSSGNFFRNIHPLFIFGHEYGGVDDIKYEDSVAFHDFEPSNWFDYCYSDNMATGFLLEEASKSILLNCYVMWYSEKGNYEVAMRSVGKFNASVTNLKISFRNDTTNNSVLLVGKKGGRGFIENPIMHPEYVQNNTYKKYLKGKVIW